MEKLKIVENSPEYYEFIRELRNDERVKHAFIQQSIISKEQQIKYMQSHEREYWICLNDNTPCGFIGVVEGDIRLATHPDFQNQGVGLFMLNFIKEKFGKSAFGKVKISNDPSNFLFIKAGYKPTFTIYTLE